MSINFFDFIIMTEREFRQNENSDKMVKTSLAAMVENLTTTEKVITETIVMRVVIMDVVRTMDLMVANVRTVLLSTLDLIIMVANASSVVAMVIIIMVVNNVLTAIVLMVIMKEENVHTAHRVSITMVANVSSVSLLQDLTMTVENNARSVLVRDNREDIVSRVEAMEIIVKAVSVRVQLTIIRMLNIA